MTKIARTKHNINTDPIKRTYNDVVYDSEMEMRFYRDWLLPQIDSGEIIDCKSQVTYELQEKFKYNSKTIQPINYIADYVITYKDNSLEVVDVKGFADAQAKLKKKMFHYRYPEINYKWLSWSLCDGGWIPYDDLKKARAVRKKEKANKKAEN